MSEFATTESYDASICQLAEKVAANAISEELARHCFMQDRLSELFDKAPRGVETFRRTIFLLSFAVKDLRQMIFPTTIPGIATKYE